LDVRTAPTPAAAIDISEIISEATRADTLTRVTST
jgi:hypothetical protein